MPWNKKAGVTARRPQTGRDTRTVIAMCCQIVACGYSETPRPNALKKSAERF